MNAKPHIRDRLSELYAYRYEPEGLHVFADYYWRTLLVVFMVFAALIVLYASIEFWRATSRMEETPSAEAPVSSPSISRAQLQSALDQFRSRQARFETLKGSLPSVLDPSR